MALVHIAHIWPRQNRVVTEYAERAALHFDALAGRAKKHKLVADPELADLIFVYAAYKLPYANHDPNLSCLFKSNYWKQYRAKCVLFNPEDFAYPFAKGIFPGVDKGIYDPCQTRSGPYVHYLHTDRLEYRNDPQNFKHLFSFCGRMRSHPLRQRLAIFHSDDNPIEDTSDIGWKTTGYKENYDDRIHDSLFVLCPRGHCPVSLRLFEAMRAGRVPVILADNWVPPDGPDWDRCSIRVAEKDYRHIPTMLEGRIEDGLEIARTARKQWLEYFGPESVFDTLVSYGSELLECQETLKATMKTLILRTRNPYRKRFIKQYLGMAR